MKTITFLTAVLIASAAMAQQSNSVNLLPYADRAPLFTEVTQASASGISGYAVDCVTGKIPTGLALGRMDESARTYTTVPINVAVASNPAAQAWAEGKCSGPVAAVVSFTVTPVTPEPAGTYLYTLLVTDMPYAQSCGYDPYNGQWCGWSTNTIYMRLPAMQPGRVIR